MKTQEIIERKNRTIVTNRKALHEYEVIQRYEAGIALQGTEVKSLRAGKCTITDAYAAFPDPDSIDIYLINLHISPYLFGTTENHEPKRRRKLLLNYREAVKLKNATQEKGFTLIPLSIYFSGPFVKIELGLVRSKRQYDKRESVKERETDIEIRRKFR